MSLILLLKLNLAEAANLKCTINTTRIEHTLGVSSSEDGSEELVEQSFPRALASTNSDSITIEPKTNGQTWSLLKEFEANRKKLKLTVNAEYINEMIIYNDDSTHEFKRMIIKFNVIEENNSKHSVKFSTPQIDDLPKLFTIHHEKEFSLGGDDTYTFALDCSNLNKS